MNSSSSTFFWVPATTKSYKDLFFPFPGSFHSSASILYMSFLFRAIRQANIYGSLSFYFLSLSLPPPLPLSLPPVKKQLNLDRPLLHLELVFKVPGRRKMQSDHLTAGFVCSGAFHSGLSQMTSFLMGFEGRKCKVDCFTDASSANLF